MRKFARTFSRAGSFGGTSRAGHLQQAARPRTLASGKAGLVAAVFALTAARGHAESVSAELAARRAPRVAFRNVHLAYVRVVANEAGFLSLPDMDGILQALLYPDNVAGRGLNLARLMRRIAEHSPRTFPLDSPFLAMASSGRRARSGDKNAQQRWTSTIELGCRVPSGWSWDARVWDKVYAERCRRLVALTGVFLRVAQSKCDSQPTTWGSEEDASRPGGPIDQGWREVRCDYSDQCAGKTLAQRYSTTDCARNRFWSWNKRAVWEVERGQDK